MALIDEEIVGHMNALVDLVKDDVDGIVDMDESVIGDYSLHISNLMVNLDKVVSRIEAQHLRLLKALARKPAAIQTDYVNSEARRIKRRLGLGLFGLFWRVMVCKDAGSGASGDTV